MAWIMANLELHMATAEDFFNWLGTIYVFYLTNRIIDLETGLDVLPKLQRRMLFNRRRAEQKTRNPMAVGSIDEFALDSL
jgi:hypothetical protein